MTRSADPPARWVYIQPTLGAVRVEWCDECLVSHAFVSIYTDPSRPPVGEWADGHEG